MAKSNVDRQVERALQTLIAPREESVRALAQILDDITGIDDKVADLGAERETLVTRAGKATQQAKDAGWKARELQDAGLVVPRPTARSVAPAQPGNAPDHKRVSSGAEPKPV